MKYWDSSALVALHVQETATPRLRELFARDSQVLTWIQSDVEIRSALHRLSREGAMTERQATTAIAAVESFWETIHVVSLVLPVKARAKRLLAIHPIRAAAAGREGFTILP